MTDCRQLPDKRASRARGGSAAALLLGAALATGLACASPGDGVGGERSDAWKAEEVARRFAAYREEFPAVRSITPEELSDRLAAGERIVLVDVREDEERAVSMLPGAISQREFERAPDRYAGATVVAYCTIGYRSGRFAAEAAREGMEVLNLEGSVLSWTHAGGELVDSDGPTRRVHVYGRAWNLAASDYEAVW